MLFHKDTCPIRNLIPLGPFGHIMPTSPYRLSSGSRNGYSLSSSFLERNKGACLMELLISPCETRSSNSIKQVVSDGGINCSTRWNTLLTYRLSAWNSSSRELLHPFLCDRRVTLFLSVTVFITDLTRCITRHWKVIWQCDRYFSKNIQ